MSGVRFRAAVAGLMAGTLGGAVGGMSVLVVSIAAAAVMSVGRPWRLSDGDLGNLIYFPLAALILSSLTAVVGMVVGTPAGLIGGSLAGGPLMGTRYRLAIVSGIAVGALSVGLLAGFWGALVGAIAAFPAAWVTLSVFNALVSRREAPPTDSAASPLPDAAGAPQTLPATAPRSTE